MRGGGASVFGIDGERTRLVEAVYDPDSSVDLIAPSLVGQG